jgi:hypothetical protein
LSRRTSLRRRRRSWPRCDSGCRCCSARDDVRACGADGCVRAAGGRQCSCGGGGPARHQGRAQRHVYPCEEPPLDSGRAPRSRAFWSFRRAVTRRAHAVPHDRRRGVCGCRGRQVRLVACAHHCGCCVPVRDVCGTACVRADERSAAWRTRR